MLCSYKYIMYNYTALLELVVVMHQEKQMHLMRYMIKLFMLNLPKLQPLLIKLQLMESNMLCLLKL